MVTGRGINEKRIESITDWTLRNIHTDLTLLFDLPVEVGQERVLKRSLDKDRFEQEKAAFFEKIRQCYLDRAGKEPERLKVIDASQNIEHIQQQVIAVLTELL